MGCCTNPPEEDISEDDSDITNGESKPCIQNKRLPSVRHPSNVPTNKLYTSRPSEYVRRRLVTLAHREVIRKCRILLDKLDQCDTRSTDWNNWIMEIMQLLVGIKLKHKARVANDQARQLMSTVLINGNTDDKAIGNHFLKLTDNYYSNCHSRTQSVNYVHSRTSSRLSQLRPTYSEKVQLDSTTEEFSEKKTIKTESFGGSQIVIPATPEILNSTWSLHFPVQVECPALKNLFSWNFDIFGFSAQTSRRPLSTMFLHICSQMNVETTIGGIDWAKLSNYILEVESHYGSNPYHNCIHGADVLHSCVNMMETKYLKEGLDNANRFALVFAAAIHDFRHPGVGNDFLVNTNDDIATTYNDNSVLENWHTSQAFKLLKKSEFNFLGKVSAAVKTLIRTKVIYAVLMTDMKRHGEHVDELGDFLENRENSGEIMDSGLLISHCLHVSDISHPTKEFRLHKMWSSKLAEEFLLQGDKELELGMEPGALFDRRKVKLEKSQIGFIEFLVLPLWINWITLIGENEQLIDQINSNKEEWLKIVTSQEKQSYSFGNLTVKEEAQEDKLQRLGTNSVVCIGKCEDVNKERKLSRLIPSAHLAEVNITMQNEIEPKVKPSEVEQQRPSPASLQPPDLEVGCRISYPVLNHARVSTEIVVLPEDPRIERTEDRESMVSNSSSRGSALPELSPKANCNNSLREPLALNFGERDGSVINMGLDEEERKKTPLASTALNIFQLQNVESFSNFTVVLTLGTVESNSFLE